MRVVAHAGGRHRNVRKRSRQPVLLADLAAGAVLTPSEGAHSVILSVQDRQKMA
jgi:hypothetical protein